MVSEIVIEQRMTNLNIIWYMDLFDILDKTFYKELSNAFRSTIEETLPDATIKNLNDKWAIARVVRELSSGKMSKAYADTFTGAWFSELLGGAFRRTFGSTWFRTVVTGGKMTQISNSIMEALSNLSPAEKNMMIRYLTKQEKTKSPSKSELQIQ